nr:monodehydroascorbate reductase [Tanacetum cinerariifolium]
MAPPVRTNDQILPRIRWVPLGKSNCYLDMEKSQGNPIYKIAVDLLKNTNFFRAFKASSTIPSIYIQQFWDTIQYDKTAGYFRCQLNEQWFVLTKDTLREALQITSINGNQAFIPSPTAEVLINFVNELGYPKLVRNVSNVVTNDMFQPWRALITIINLCLTRKTSGFERPRALVPQILWGIVKRANIDYAKRIWEEFTQSIHTFIEDKWNLSRHTSGKKRATLIVIPSICFTKLIIHHLQRRHKFHLRPNSPLYLPNEEPVLGYLKFSAKGTKREVFGMPILGSLITADIQEASYYQEYLAKVAQHQRYLAGKTRSNPVSPAPKPTKPARKPKSTVHKAPPRPAVSTPATSAQPAPTSAPAKPQEKKRKQATETSDKPPKAKKSKYGWVSKKRTLKHVATLKAEDVPIIEPQVTAEDAELQKVLEESMKTAYADAPRGPLPPVVIREPKSGKYQPLSEVPGKGKDKVSEEQVAHDLLSLQKPKKKSPADQYIFQRRVSEPTGSSGHDESPYTLLGQSDSEEESEKVVLRADEGDQDEGQAGASEVHAGQDPGDAEAKVQSIPSLVVHAGSDREHMDLDVAGVSPQPSTEQLDEGFTATAYPKVQESLKLAVEEQVLLEEHASSSGTLSSLQYMSKDISFGDQFFSDRPSDADKNAETKVESMVNVPIQQAMSSISLMTSPIIDLTSRLESPKEHQQFKATTTDTTTTTTTTTLPPPQAPQQSNAEAMMIQRVGELEHIMANLIQVNKDMEERLDKHGARLYTLEQLYIPQQVSIAISEVVTDAVDWAMQAPLRNRFRDLPEADMKEILHQRMWETESNKTHEDHTQLFEALEKSMNHDHSEELAQDLAEARKKKKKSRESPKMPHGSPPHHPPPPPPPAGPSKASGAPGASGSSQIPPPPPHPLSSTNKDSPSKGSAAPSPSKTAASAEYQAWTTTDVRVRPSAHIPKVNLRQDWWKPLEEERPATPEPAWSIPSSDTPVPPNNWASVLASNYSPPPEDSLLAQTGDMATFIDWFYKRREYHKLLTDSVDDPILRNNVSKPLPLCGPPGQVTIQSDFFFNKDLEYLRYGSKGSRPALSISKMKAAYYPDAGLEQLVPDQFWIDEECKYDIAAMYGNSHWWFQRQRFYIDRHTFEGDRSAIRTHMWILSVVRIEVFLCMDSAEPHQTSPQWDATGFEYKHDFTVIDSPRAVIFWDKYGVQMMMRFNEIHKFSDGTLQQIDEALDYRVKEFRINRMNPEAFEDKADLPKPRELCWWTRQRGRLQTFEVYRMIKSFWHSRPLSDDL